MVMSFAKEQHATLMDPMLVYIYTLKLDLNFKKKSITHSLTGNSPTPENMKQKIMRMKCEKNRQLRLIELD